VLLWICGRSGAYHCGPHPTRRRYVGASTIWPIWVPPQGRALVAQDGIVAAQGMVAALQRFEQPKSVLAFLDIDITNII